MFFEIFLFEIKYRLKRPDIYIYFLVFFLFSALSFANGSVPAQSNIYVNAPVVLSRYYIIFSVLMMIVIAAIMGAPIYRDLEFHTNEYYYSYPITKNGYFWGRFLGSFLFVAFIGSSFLWGSIVGIFIGPKLGWLNANRVGPFHWEYFLQPFFGFLIPNLFLTSSIFFALVAHFKNNKVIYSGAAIIYLSYLISIFILHNLENNTVVFILDAFAFSPIDIREHLLSPAQLNKQVISINGLLLLNRIIWMSAVLIFLGFTYYRFSFLRFLNFGKERKNKLVEIQTFADELPVTRVNSYFGKGYQRRVLFTLTKIEWLSIIRDNYFRLILSAGTFFLGFIFFMGFMQRYGVPDFPRTVILMDIYNHNFLLFIFVIILFYTGEVIHREKVTGFAIINDALPPSNWIFYISKLLALTLLSFLLATVPIIAGLAIQLLKGFTQFNFRGYFIACYLISLPTFIEMILFCFAVHTVVNNKFAGHAVGVMIWVAIMALHGSGVFDYRLLLYSYTPDYLLNDMDEISPSFIPLFWFNIYWLFAGGLLLVLGALFFYRGSIASFRERIRIAKYRFEGRVKWVTGLVFTGFILIGAFNYYNVSYLHTWLTRKERELRAVGFEKQLKKFERLPQPGIIRLRLFEDIYPEKRKIAIRAFATLINQSDSPIDSLLLDGDQFSSYMLKYHGKEMPYTIPLVYPRGKFSFLKPSIDSSMYRLYRMPHPLDKGDTIELEMNSLKENKGFSNSFDGMSLLNNGTALPSVLPGIGYEEEEELSGDEKRREYGLPKKDEELTAQDDSEGVNHILLSNISSLACFEATISTALDQTAIAPGVLEREWKQGGRHYFHYILKNPGTYFPFPVLSAKYAVLRDTVKITPDLAKNIEIYYYPSHTANLSRFVKAYKDGLRYFSTAFGSFQFAQMQLFESTTWVNTGSFAHSVIYGEDNCWNANFTSQEQFDYCYFLTACQLAHQWWSYQVAPNHALGTNNISEGLPKYSALVLLEKEYGPENMGFILRRELLWYLNRHQFTFVRENPLLNSNYDFVWDNKAALVFYGLKNLIGEDKMNKILHSFRDQWGFRTQPPFVGSKDLYKIIKANVPDSLQYYLTDNFERLTFYNNRILGVSASPTGKNNQYKLRVNVSVAKYYLDSNGKKIEGTPINDYIDIGVFGPNSKNKDGKTQENLLFIQKYRLKSGITTIDLLITGQPTMVGIDPFNELIDQTPDDNKQKL